VWKSTTEGQSWERISPDLTRHDPATMGPSGGPITLDQTGVETYATVFTIAPSPLDGQTIWTGSDDGLVQVTRDGGKAWENVTPKDLPECLITKKLEAGDYRVRYHECPECGDWITLERDNLVGWQDAGTEGEAERGACWRCLTCQKTFDDAARAKAHRRAVLVHRGQTVDNDGAVLGAFPDTSTLGFRWSAGNNLFLSAAFLAGEEWRALRVADKDGANRKLCQQSWVVPPPLVKDFDEAITIESIEERSNASPRGLVPAWAQLITVGCDLGKRIHHWVAVAWALNGDGHVIDYGVVDTHSDRLGEERGIENGLEQVNDLTANGWTVTGSGNVMRLTAGGADSGGPAWDRFVHAFCKRHPKFVATKGVGVTQEERRRHYTAPRSTGNIVLKVGDQYHWVRLKHPRGTNLLEFNTDHFKTWVHLRLQTPDGEPGTLRIFGTPAEHRSFAAHLASEQEIIDRETGLPRWVRINRNNHYLDALVLAAVVARTKGVAAAPVAADGPTVTLEVIEATTAPKRGVVPQGAGNVHLNRGGRGRIRSKY
jgi:phage terminase large subunit GpA-like protein